MKEYYGFRVGDQVQLVGGGASLEGKKAVVVDDGRQVVYFLPGFVPIKIEGYQYNNSSCLHHLAPSHQLVLTSRIEKKSYSRLNQKTLRKRARDQLSQTLYNSWAADKT